MTDAKRWEAVITNDTSFDGKFFYAVKTTGIYCRPSCTSRRSKRENTLFFETSEAAEAAGFRPCKRCRPDLLTFEPQKELAEEARYIIEEHYTDSHMMKACIQDLGISSHRLEEIFRKQYGKSTTEYLSVVRITEAMKLLTDSDKKIVDIAYELGFGSISSFYTLFKRYTSTTPAAFRRNQGVTTI